jgi:hypothetical protein
MDLQFPPQHAAASGALGRFAPQWFDDQRTPANLAYALYSLDAAGLSGKRQLRLDWQAAGLWQMCFIALPDFDANRWVLRQPDAHFRLNLSAEEFAAATRPASVRFYAIVILIGGGTPWELTSLSLADPPPFAIAGLSPTEGWDGQQLTLRVSTDPPTAPGQLAFEWEFGGPGVEPEHSTSDSILVRLVEPGNYPCSVRIVTPGAETDQDFTFTVKPLAPPEITDIVPGIIGGPGLAGVSGIHLSGLEGDLAALDVVNAGGPADGWYWQFGAAAAPGTSASSSPEFRWGPPGEYQCRVVALNAAGLDICDFGVTIEPQPAPEITAVLSSGPLYVDHLIQLSASNSGGVPESYSWDFGAACQPPTSTASYPEVVPLAEGQFNCSVTASNSSGSSTFDFVLNVETATIPPPGPG